MAETATTESAAPQTGVGPGPSANTAISQMGGPPAGRAVEDDGTIEVDSSDAVDEVENLDEDTIDQQAAAAKDQPGKKAEAAQASDLDAQLKSLGLNEKQHASLLSLIREQFAPKAAEGKEAAAAAPITADIDQVLVELAAEIEGKPAAEPAAAAAPGAIPTQGDTGPVKFGDIGDQFSTAEEFYQKRLEAETSGDFRKVNDIDDAIFARRLYNTMPAMTKLFSRMAQAEIKRLVPEKVMQEAERSWSERTEVGMRDRVEQSLRTKLGEGFSKMLSEDGGKPVEWQGKQMSPIPYNRIVAEHPYIGKIKEFHANPEVAAALTWAGRYGEAYRIYQRQATEAQRIKQVAKQAGAASAQSAIRTERERGRSSAAAGGRSSGTFNNGSDSPEDKRQFLRDNLPGEAFRKLSKI